MPGPEQVFSVTPAVDALVGLGYYFLPQLDAEAARDGLNQVLLRDAFIASVQRLNGVPEEVAVETYNDLLRITDNEQWTRILRGDYSRRVPGQSEKKTIRLIDFLNPANNQFVVTEELTVEAAKTRRADLVIYVNGIPLVVIECKSPLSFKDKTGEAFDQIKQYEEQIPRLFYSNAFSIVTNGHSLLYGPTGAPSQYWAPWKDPWPKTEKDFDSDFHKSLWCLLEPARLLDILAHFIVFERDPTTGAVIKKMCRYQQFRAANKIVDRVVEGTNRRGLVWHTQGSGKSLTMVFAALKLKTHRTLDAPALTNPNLLVLTDRIQLDDQISGTFQACGIRNAKQIKRGKALLDELHSQKKGLTLLSMIFKFDKSQKPVANSADWIILVDECHRTQEKDLGAYLRATLPDARFFGFTGTPVKKNDHDTYANFGEPGEGYLDRYSIDDAVADGATVPIRYTMRKTDWHLEGREIDILFDQTFANLSDEEITDLKQSGAKFARLVKHSERVSANAYDIFTHYRLHAYKDGFKAQVATLDREAVVLYKEALDKVIAKHLEREGIPAEQAQAEADAFTACVYTAHQADDEPDEDKHTDRVRGLLRRYFLNPESEKDAVDAFKKKGQPPYLLIVCDKLLTGFDAPIESVMYLDKPLKEHNLLQAIARTNRVSPLKQFGLIVDYIGVTNNLDEALASYRQEDVANALRNLDELEDKLRDAHAEVLPYMKKVREKNSRPEHAKQEYQRLVQELAAEDAWYRYALKASGFLRAYQALSPEPAVLAYTSDMKWVGGSLPWGRLEFEGKGDPSLRDYTTEVREMLEEHLRVTGLTTVCKLRRLTDPDFFVDLGDDDEAAEDELRTAAVRKTAELKKEIADRVADNAPRYEKFSELLRQVLQRFDQGVLSYADKLKEMEQLARAVQAEDQAHQSSGLTKEAFGVLRILEAHGNGAGNLEEIARQIDQLYVADATAPPGWTRKPQLRKELRQQVRGIVFNLGLTNWKEIPAEVDAFAGKHYVKV